MKELNQYILPYLISNGVAIIFLLAAWKNTRIARFLFALLFLYASVYNMFIGLFNPDSYLGFANLALPFYRNFINGWFSHYNHIVIPLIAIGQFFIGVGMLFQGWWVKWACIGAIIFLFSIIPLMVGSAFPFSLTVSWAAWLVLKNDQKNYIWRSDRLPRATHH